jgi:hypothetical protein
MAVPGNSGPRCNPAVNRRITNMGLQQPRGQQLQWRCQGVKDLGCQFRGWGSCRFEIWWRFSGNSSRKKSLVLPRLIACRSFTRAAEGVGFEPTVALLLRLISSQVPSTSSATLPLIQKQGGENIAKKAIVDDLVPVREALIYRQPS